MRFLRERSTIQNFTTQPEHHLLAKKLGEDPVGIYNNQGWTYECEDLFSLISLHQVTQYFRLI